MSTTLFAQSAPWVYSFGMKKTIKIFPYNKDSKKLFTKEAEKIKKTPSEIIDSLHKEINLKVCAKDFYNVIRESLDLHWTRDPFDRIMVAHASLNNNTLVTKDEIIRSHYKHAVW